MVWIIDKSCEFVTVSVMVDGNDDDYNQDSIVLTRGIQRGMFRPGDTCQAWGKYGNDNNLKEDGFDTKMILARISAALSIVFGFFILVLWILIGWYSYRNNTNSEGSDEGETTPNNHADIDTKQQTPPNQRSFIVVWMHRVGAFLALTTAVLQALTHAMVKSDFCHARTTNDGFKLEECDKSTAAYNLTFATMGLYVSTCALLCTPPMQIQRHSP